jgi:hypothetical protein
MKNERARSGHTRGVMRIGKSAGVNLTANDDSRRLAAAKRR